MRASYRPIASLEMNESLPRKARTGPDRIASLRTKRCSRLFATSVRSNSRLNGSRPLIIRVLCVAII